MVIAAMLLLSTFTLGVNSTLITSSSMGLEMEANLDALSYGQSLMDEVLDKSFDEKTITTRRFDADEMSAFLGPDAGESFTLPDSSASSSFQSKLKYDDVDDYNGYVRKVLNSRLDVFTLTVTVHYIEELPTNSTFHVSSSRTFYKDVVIDISNPYMSYDDSSPAQRKIELRGLSIYRKYF